jgi:hypothetical protein
MSLRLVQIVAVLAFTVTALGEDWTSSAAGPRAAHVTVEPVQPVMLTAGRTAKAEIRFRVAPGFHINSSKPSSELLIPTLVEFSPIPQVKIGKVTYPPGEDFVFKAAPDEKLNVYSGDVVVTVLLSAAKPLSPGAYRLQADIRYQACDDRSCFPPKTVRLEVPVVVAPRKS